MIIPSPTTALTAAVCHTSPAFYQAHVRLWVPEHLDRLAAALTDWRAGKRPDPNRPPRFAAECTPSLAPVQAQFDSAMSLWASDPTADDVPTAFAAALQTVGCDGLLLLLGQRRTSATLCSAAGIPPTRSELLAAAQARHRLADALTVAGRALAKHSHRSQDRFWGESRGSAEVQNAQAMNLVCRIVAGHTWWNTFGHHLHETVYEARLFTGHGARWSGDGRTFIGFLEPFDEELCPSLNADGSV